MAKKIDLARQQRRQKSLSLLPGICSDPYVVKNLHPRLLAITSRRLKPKTIAARLISEINSFGADTNTTLRTALFKKFPIIVSALLDRETARSVKAYYKLRSYKRT